ncbi:CPBP family intramembrane metalloprotease [Synergistaceae bacterium OttesenSCG-928-I11]|nr:CPBP family intramembrane metalloprotease [Synergistaceae bacterium OttesenSCG-928-I11]
MDFITRNILPILAGLLLIYTPFFWCRKKNIDPESFGLSWKFKKKDLLECFALTFAVLGLLTVVSLNWPWESLPRSSSVGRTLNIASAGIAAAIIEEIFYRGWLQQLFKKKMHPIFAVMLTSAIFASSHVFVAKAPFMIAVFFPGCIMGYLRERHGNISTATLFHGLSNLWAVWLSPLKWPTIGWVMQRLSDIIQ